MGVELNNESGDTVDLHRMQTLAAFAMEKARVSPDAELSVLFVDEPTITDLNRLWMNEDGPTDVLSFPMDELRPPPPGGGLAVGVLGDIVICPPYAARQARRRGTPVKYSYDLLLVHGLLHLLGFDHAEEDERKEMFGLQTEILTMFYLSFRARRSARRGTDPAVG